MVWVFYPFYRLESLGVFGSLLYFIVNWCFAQDGQNKDVLVSMTERERERERGREGEREGGAF